MPSDSLPLRGQAALVTGAARGLGRAYALRLARLGLAAELGPHGIRANCISPGVMLTARVAQMVAQRGIGSPEELAQIPLGRFGEPEDCAGALEFLVTDLSRHVTGQVISVCGGAVLTPN